MVLLLSCVVCFLLAPVAERVFVALVLCFRRVKVMWHDGRSC